MGNAVQGLIVDISRLNQSWGGVAIILHIIITMAVWL